MNVHAAIIGPRPVRLTVDDFWLLKQSGTFAAYAKAELIEGELTGVPRPDDDAPETDASVPIRLRIQDYLLLAGAGAFERCPKTELIDGVVYEVSPQHRPHGFVKDELAYRLRRALETLDSPLHVATEQSVAIAPYSEPQPDIILTTDPRGAGAIPVGSVALLVEVAASTLAFDLNDKARIYAAAGVGEYWVADVAARMLHQLWAPAGEAYTRRREIAFGADIAAATIAGLTIATGNLG